MLQLYVGQFGCRNDMVFDNKISNTFMYVIFRTIYRIRTWSLLHKEEETKKEHEKWLQTLDGDHGGLR